MTFQIHSLSAEPFAPYFEMSEAELAERSAVVQTVTEHPGTPCRVSLEDAGVGERVVLLNYEHHDAATPYRASHAIFVREGAVAAQPAVDEVPKVIARRVISARLFDEAGMMIDASVVPGAQVGGVLTAAFRRGEVAFVHLHNAGPGCFAARVSRAD